MSLSEGLAERDLGIARTLNKNNGWRDAALDVIKALPSGWRGTGEDIRSLIDEEPKHPNAWGGLVNVAIRKKYIVPTGSYVPMSAKSSHGRKTAVYVKAA